MKRTFTGYDRSKGGLQKKARVYAKKKMASKRTQAVVKRAVAQMAEKKQVWTGWNTSDIDDDLTTNADFFCLNLIQQGDGAWNRVGRKIQLESVRLRGTITTIFVPQTTTLNRISQTVRLILLWDAEPHGSAAEAFDSVFNSVDQVGNRQTRLYAPVNPDKRERYRIIRDMSFSMNAQLALSGGTENKEYQKLVIDEFIPLKGLTSVYSVTSDPLTIASVQTGALYLIMRAHTDNTSLCWSNSEDTHALLTYTDL